MTIEKRRFIRFSLDIPAFRCNEDEEKADIMIKQISIGGCLVELDTYIHTGDEARIEIPLPNKNRLPLPVKVIYRTNEKTVGVSFQNISQFEQELVGNIISDKLESEGLPVLVNPFTQPPRYAEQQKLAQQLEENELTTKK